MKTELFPVMRAGFDPNFEYNAGMYSQEEKNLDNEEDRVAEVDAHVEESSVQEPCDHYEVGHGNLPDGHEKGTDDEEYDNLSDDHEEGLDDKEAVFQDIQDIDGEITQCSKCNFYNY
jgi:hypothetical protein